MSPSSWMPQARRASFLCVAAMLTTVLASAQSSAVKAPSNAATFSSSQWSSSASTSSSAQLAELSMPAASAALPSAPAPSASAGGQGQYSNGGWWQRWKSNFAFEAGGGFNAPVSSNVTYGGNFNIGVGTYFNPHLAGLFEFQFLDDKVPGKIIAQTQGAATGGHSTIIGLTAAPFYDFFPKANNDFYATGGGGYYHTGTDFTYPTLQQFCYYFYCGYGTTNQSVASFGSNSGGWNIGGGYMHRFGGMYGTSKMKLFAEVRYLEVFTPAILGKSVNNVPPITIPADTKVIPVTFGLRW